MKIPKLSRPILLIVFLLLVPHATRATIRYRISLAHSEEHLFHVTVQISKAPLGTVVAIPAWNALYEIRDFGYRVRNVEACVVHGEGQHAERIGVRKLDKQTWQLGEPGAAASGSDGNLSISYTIEWDDPGPFDSQLNAQHAFVNFAEVLMYLPDRRAEESVVQFIDVPAGWKIAAQLPAGPAPNEFVAQSYDLLVDAPAEAGKFDSFTFADAGAHFRVVVDGKSWDRFGLEEGLHKIVAYELRLMGGAPYAEYTFFLHIGPYTEVGGGGMEHANCTAIGGASQPEILQIAAHEFFHAWNVKRIRPQTLQPVDYTKEQWTRALWFAEGVTSTYGSFALLRSGIWNKGQFYSDLAEEIRRLQNRPAHSWQSAEESSLDTWLDKYTAYNSPQRSISYYNKGQILGDLLDLAIRDATDNRKSLDDVMRTMNSEFAMRGRYYNDSADIRATVEQISGKSFDDFFRRYVSGVDEIPYDEFLSAAGLHLKETPRTEAGLGFSRSRGTGGNWLVARVESGSDAEKAGLRDGDEVLAIDGEKPPRNLDGWLRGHAPGDTVTLRVRREGQERNVPIVLGSHEIQDSSVDEIENANPRQLRIRDGFLHGTTD
ncbi:MAG: PDZ domain-containing protein [Candidatus Acidiferrales bacterium]